MIIQPLLHVRKLLLRTRAWLVDTSNSRERRDDAAWQSFPLQCP